MFLEIKNNLIKQKSYENHEFIWKPVENLENAETLVEVFEKKDISFVIFKFKSSLLVVLVLPTIQPHHQFKCKSTKSKENESLRTLPGGKRR